MSRERRAGPTSVAGLLGALALLLALGGPAAPLSSAPRDAGPGPAGTVVLALSCASGTATMPVEATVSPPEVVDGARVSVSWTVTLPDPAAAAPQLRLSWSLPPEARSLDGVEVSAPAGLAGSGWLADAGHLTVTLTPSGGVTPLQPTVVASIRLPVGLAPATVAFGPPTSLTVVGGGPDGSDDECTADAPAPLVGVVVTQATTPTTVPPTTAPPPTPTTVPPTPPTTSPRDPAADGDAPSPAPLAPTAVPTVPPRSEPGAASRVVVGDAIGVDTVLATTRGELASTTAAVEVARREVATRDRQEHRLEAQQRKVARKLDRTRRGVELLAADAYVVAVDAYLSMAATSNDAVALGVALEGGVAGFELLVERQARLVADLGAAASRRAEAVADLDRVRARQADLEARLAEGRAQRTTFELGGSVAVSGFRFPVVGASDFSDTWHAPRSGGRKHLGTDIFAPEGAPLRAVERGVLARVGTDGLGGTKLWLVGESGTHYYYAHLSAYAEGVADGRLVEAGAVIGYVGHTGNARTTPPHLHFEVHPGGGPAVDAFPMLVAADRFADDATDVGAAVRVPSPGSPTTTATTVVTPGAPDRRPVGPTERISDERPEVAAGWSDGAALTEGLRAPSAVAVGPSGQVVVADATRHRIVVRSATLSPVASWGGAGGEDGRFRAPEGVAVDPAGDVWVADTGNNRIQHFTPEGRFVDAWGSTGSGPGALNEPTGVAVDGDGRVYVADRLNSRVQVFERDGTPVRRWGEFGVGPGQLGAPSGLALGPDGDVYVADTLDGRIQRFTAEGRFVAQWREGLGRPVAVVVTGAGELVVADRSPRGISQHGADGRQGRRWGRGGDVGRPSALAFDHEGRLLVADDGGRVLAVRWP